MNAAEKPTKRATLRSVSEKIQAPALAQEVGGYDSESIERRSLSCPSEGSGKVDVWSRKFIQQKRNSCELPTGEN
jgi:hypothetical protein